MAGKRAFTSKDIDHAFHISNREQVYLVDQGYLEPDIQADRPRLYSPYNAVKAGAIRFFEAHGYKLERAYRLAEACMVAAHILNKRYDGSRIKEEVEANMTIVNGVAGTINLVVPGLTASPILLFVVGTTLTADEGQEWGTGKIFSSCNYNLRALLRKWSVALGGDPEDIALPSSIQKRFKITKTDEENAIALLTFVGDPAAK